MTTPEPSMLAHSRTTPRSPRHADPGGQTPQNLRWLVVTAGAVHPLRCRVLRPGLPVEASRYDLDDDPRTTHVAAVDVAAPGLPIAVATALPQACVDPPTPVDCPQVLLGADTPAPRLRRLRGMAVSPEAQGRGVGRFLLAGLMEAVRARADSGADGGASDDSGAGSVDGSNLAPKTWWWANARTSAVGFYTRQGWRVVSAEFEIAGVGPHVVMVFGPG
ncbi:MAG: GNAT family N-acetyltransferase [Planctomycetota bacterium]